MSGVAVSYVARAVAFDVVVGFVLALLWTWTYDEIKKWG